MVGSTFNPRPQSINEVVDYVLKRLGVQLLEINVTEQQILDRITDAIVYFQEYHVDGTYEGYFKTKIEPTALVLEESVENKASCGECVNGTDFSAIIHSISSDFKTLFLFDVSGTLSATDTVTISNRPEEFTVNSLTLGPSDTGWVQIPDNVDAIVQVLQVPREGSGSTSQNTLASLTSDLYSPFSSTSYMSQFYNYRGMGLGISFYLQEVRRETMDWLTRLQPWADFNRYTNRAYLNAYDFKQNIGNWLVFKVLVSVDPEEFPEMYSDLWFLQYCVEKVRLQWGENLQKFEDVALLNGVKVNGSKMIDMAEKRIKDLEDEMWSRYRQVDDFFLA